MGMTKEMVFKKNNWILNNGRTDTGYNNRQHKSKDWQDPRKQ